MLSDGRLAVAQSCEEDLWEETLEEEAAAAAQLPDPAALEQQQQQPAEALEIGCVQLPDGFSLMHTR